MKEAAFYTRLADNKVRCDLCPHHCRLTDGKRGICLTRQNVKGSLVANNYCCPVSSAIDPIEKKPLYHYYPGTRIFSTGPNGCTFKCSFCQNSEISQSLLPSHIVPAADLVHTILRSKTIGVAYTYSEPYIWFETILEVGKKIKDAGLHNVMVTNGYMEPKPLAQLLDVVDAMNIDIKSSNTAFYKRLCKGELAPVLRTCESVKKSAHLEITNLLIQDENDTEDEIRTLVRFIAEHLGRDTPLHLSRCFPRFKLHRPPTAELTLMNAWRIARESLDYVYVGNMPTPEQQHTYCPSCAALLIRRQGYHVEIDSALNISNDRSVSCKHCGHTIAMRV